MVTQRIALPPPLPGTRFPMTSDDFWAWDHEGPKAEWVDGEVIVHMAALFRHEEIVYFLVKLFGAFLDLNELGFVYGGNTAVDIPMRPSIREPDVFVVLNEHRAWIRREGFFGPPDLVVEVISDDSPRRDEVDKRREYEALGVPEYILVDSREGRRRFAYLRLGPDRHYVEVEPDADGRYHSLVLLGLWIDPAWFWQETPPNPLRLVQQMAADAWSRFGEQRP